MADTIMDGVWIININPADKPYNMVACAVAGMIWFGLVALFTCLLEDRLDWRDRMICIVAITALGAMAGIFVGAMHNRYLNPVTYDVMIGDNVSFNEFAEQYEIIEQNGNIYTVKEKKQ